VGKANTSTLYPAGAVGPETPQEVRAQVLRNGNWEGLIPQVRKDGRPFTAHVVVTPLRHDSGSVAGFLLISRDVSDEVQAARADREQAEEALRKSEERYRALFDNNPQPMWVYDVQTLAFLAVNDAALAKYGYSRDQFLGMTITYIRPPEEVPAFLKLLADNAGMLDYKGFWRHRRRDGSLIEVEITSHALTFGDRPARLVLAQDVTERMRLEAQLRQAQKMEAVGQLEGGVAHDFNNLLTVITGYGDLVLDRLPAGDPTRELIGEITKAGARAAALTRQLLAFSRKQVLAPQVVDLNAIVLDMEKMLRRVIGEDIDLATRLQPSLGRVRADPSQVEQVLLNLAVNARDAMPTGGKLTIETHDIELDEGYAQTHTEVRPGPYVLVAVSDTGCGMIPEVQARIFEPFFTTKEPGKGTGLGLATVYGIVKQSGGHIDVYSEPGLGTTFKAYLPCVRAVAKPKSHAGLLPTPRGNETVLLVEDEDAVRALSRHVLQSSGYTVLVAAHGREALRIGEQHPPPIHLLVTDVVMPELGGRQLAEQLLRLHPEMKVLYLSGYTDDAVVRHGVLHEEVNFLLKPFSPAVLAYWVREVLDARPGGDKGT
jgi:PAS domain S-box-containing protein